MLQNKGKTYLSNYHNIDGAVTTDSKSAPTETTTTSVLSKPIMLSGTVAIKPKPILMESTLSKVAPPTTVVIAPTPILATPISYGGGGGGGGGEKQADANPEGGAVDNKGKIYTISGLAFLAGAIGGYLLAKHYKKNPMVFAGAGALGLAISTYAVTTQFVYPSAGEKKSGFVKGNAIVTSKTAKPIKGGDGTWWCQNSDKQWQKCGTLGK
jgi:hypothetical protein